MRIRRCGGPRISAGTARIRTGPSRCGASSPALAGSSAPRIDRRGSLVEIREALRDYTSERVGGSPSILHGGKFFLRCARRSARVRCVHNEKPERKLSLRKGWVLIERIVSLLIIHQREENGTENRECSTEPRGLRSDRRRAGREPLLFFLH